PEAAGRGERRGAEYVLVLELPHAGQELAQAAVGERVAEPLQAGGVVHQAGVAQGKKEGRQGESRETERTGVRDRGEGDGGRRRRVFADAHLVVCLRVSEPAWWPMPATIIRAFGFWAFTESGNAVETATRSRFRSCV